MIMHEDMASWWLQENYSEEVVHDLKLEGMQKLAVKSKSGATAIIQ